jgi:hypothetical protein
MLWPPLVIPPVHQATRPVPSSGESFLVLFGSPGPALPSYSVYLVGSVLPVSPLYCHLRKDRTTLGPLHTPLVSLAKYKYL